MALHCPYCDKEPNEIEEYIERATEEKTTPEQIVKTDEGTYHRNTQLFCCTACYIKVGMPVNQKLHEAFGFYRERVRPI